MSRRPSPFTLASPRAAVLGASLLAACLSGTLPALGRTGKSGAAKAGGHSRPVEALHAGHSGGGTPGRGANRRKRGRGLVKVGSLRLPGPSGDVWIHERVAYVGSEGTGAAAGIRIVDLSKPGRPRLLSRAAAIPGTTQEDVAVLRVRTPFFEGRLLATGIQAREDSPGAPRGLDLWDVSNPRIPVHLAFWASSPTGSRGPRGVHELFLFQRGDRAYVAAMVPESEEHEGIGDFRLVDVTDPRNPVQASDWGAFKDGGLPADPDAFPWGHSATVNAAGTMAVVSFWDAGAVFLDLADPSQPRLAGRITYPAGSAGNTHSAVFSGDEQRLFITDENLEPVPGPEPWGFLRIWDIADRSQPRQVGKFVTPNAAALPAKRGLYCAHNTVVRGNLAYLSWYNDGVRVVDVSDPEAPRQVASFVPPRAIVWGVHEENGLVVASDLGYGLYVLRLQAK